MPDNRIQLIVEAFDKTKEAFRDLEKNFKGLESNSRSAIGGIKSLFSDLKAHWLALSVSIGGALLVMNKIKNEILETANAGEELLKMSKQTGISVDNLSKLKYAAAISETSIESLNVGMRAFQNALAGTNDEGQDTTALLRSLGVTAKDPYEALQQVGAALRNIDDAAIRSKVTVVLFGRSGRDLIPMLLELSETLQEAKKNAHIFTEKEAKAADEFNDNITIIKNNLKGLVYTIGNQVIPALNDLFAAFGKGSEKNILYSRLATLDQEIAQMEKGFLGIKPQEGSIAARQIENLKKQRQEILDKLWDLQRGPEPSKKITPEFSKEKEGKEGGKDKEEEQWLGKIKESVAYDEYMRRSAEEQTREEQERWETRIREEVEYDKYMRQSAEEQTRRAREIQDLEISHQLAVIDLKEQSFEITKAEANEQRLTQYEKKLENLKQAYDETVGIADKDLERRKILIQIDEIQSAIAEKLQRQKERFGTLTQGMKDGWRDFIDNLKTEWQDGFEIVQTSLKSLQDTISNISLDAMKGKFKDWHDYVNMLLDSIRQKLADMLSQRLLFGEDGGGGLMSLFGGLGNQVCALPEGTIAQYAVHQGGYIPRFHFGGLSSDEIPAILQRGEYVVSRKGVEALDKINRGETAEGQSGGTYIFINAVDAKSFFDVVERNPGAIIKVITSDLRNNGPIRHAIRSNV